MRAWIHHFTAILAAYGPWGIFFLSVVDSFPVPMPAVVDVILIGTAAGSAKEPHNAYFAAAMAVLGSLVGNAGLFMAARRGAGWLRRSEPAPGSRQRFRKWFDRYGLVTVFVPAVTPLVPLPLKFFVISAAAMRTPFSRFLAVIALGRVIRFFGEVYLGLELGHNAQAFLTRNSWLMAGSALALAIAVFILMRLKNGRPKPVL